MLFRSAKITHATGLDIVADKVAKALGEEDCGCNRRREKLNELIPFTNNKPTSSTPLPSTFTIKKNLSVQVDGELMRYTKGEEVYIDEIHPLAQSLDYFIGVGAIESIDKM